MGWGWSGFRGLGLITPLVKGRGNGEGLRLFHRKAVAPAADVETMRETAKSKWQRGVVRWDWSVHWV